MIPIYIYAQIYITFPKEGEHLKNAPKQHQNPVEQIPNPLGPCLASGTLVSKGLISSALRPCCWQHKSLHWPVSIPCRQISLADIPWLWLLHASASTATQAIISQHHSMASWCLLSSQLLFMRTPLLHSVWSQKCCKTTKNLQFLHYCIMQDAKASTL